MDELARLVENAKALVGEGYYSVPAMASRSPSFLESLGTSAQASDVVAEIKYASPTMSSGRTAADFDALLERIVGARPLGLSVLAEPRIFGGGLELVRRASTKGLPVLFKDIVVDRMQIEAAEACGASAVLVIQRLFERHYVDGSPATLIDAAHDRDLDVLLEVHTLEEWDAAAATDADVLGINNRDLSTMRVDLATTPHILSARRKDRPVIAMSGVASRADVEALLRAGADAVLVGTSIMAHENPAAKLEDLAHGPSDPRPR
ncbi:MAG: indole-3-glycerol-phosphate synthase [Methanobacteriota archaeon]